MAALAPTLHPAPNPLFSGLRMSRTSGQLFQFVRILRRCIIDDNHFIADCLAPSFDGSN